MGRKKKLENEKYKNVFTLQMTDEQIKDIRNRANKEQMPISVYIRRILFPIKK